MTSISGIEFDDAWPHRIVVVLDGVQARVISRPHLLQNKLASVRPKDIVDVEILRSEGR